MQALLVPEYAATLLRQGQYQHFSYCFQRFMRLRGELHDMDEAL